MTSPCVPVSPRHYGSRLWPPETYAAASGLAALSVVRPLYSMRDGLPPVPPLIPSSTSPKMMKFTHFKQTLSPGKTPVNNGEIVSPTRREVSSLETTRIEAFSKSPVFDKPFMPRKREHSPEKKHFNFDCSMIAAAAKKPFIANSQSMNASSRQLGDFHRRTSSGQLAEIPRRTGQLGEIPHRTGQLGEIPHRTSTGQLHVGDISHRTSTGQLGDIHRHPSTGKLTEVSPRATTKPPFSYGTHSMPMLPNSPSGPGRDLPRMSRRDPVVPSRLRDDYEIEHFRTKGTETAARYQRCFRNGHETVRNGHISVAKKESTKVPEMRSPSNKTSVKNHVDSVKSPRSSDEDSALSPVSPNSPFQREYATPADRARRISSSSTDSGTEEPREGID